MGVNKQESIKVFTGLGSYVFQESRGKKENHNSDPDLSDLKIELPFPCHCVLHLHFP